MSEIVRKTARRTVLPPRVLRELSMLQDGLNKIIDKDWVTKRTCDDWALAVTMESTELMDSYPWKWWKNVNAAPDFKNVKIELVDILHFSLSGTMQMSAKGAEIAPFPFDANKDIVTPLAVTANAVSTFRNVIHLCKYHRFDVITEHVVAAADDLDFNLVAYYVAKHTLNYVRQLGGYKSGEYVKVNKGVEDNELLHACIDGVTVADALGEASHVAVWDAVMTKAYDAFAVPEPQRKTVADWIPAAEAAKLPLRASDANAATVAA